MCIRDSGSVDPIRDIEVINVELVLSDLEIITTRIGKIGKKAMTTKNKDDVKEIELLERIKDALEKNIPVRKLGLDDEEKKIISSFNLITLKPIIYALNVSEEDIVNGNEYTNRVCEYAKNEGSEVVIISAKIEMCIRDRLIDDLGVDLTNEAKNGKLDPVIGREKEVRRVMEILCRRTKNNPILIGEAGVGKTAIVEELSLSLIHI